MPTTITIYILYVVCVKAESIFGRLFQRLFGNEFYIPGMGILLTFFFIMFIGVLVSNYMTGRVIAYFTSRFEKLPFLRTIYGTIKDLMSMFSQSGSTSSMKNVVLVNLGRDMECLGLLTREDFSDFNEGTFANNKVAVYLPLSYMIGGVTTFVSRDKIREIDIPVDQALKLSLTGWIKANQSIG